MFIFVYGRRKTRCGIGEAHAYCPSCESHQWADIIVFSLYYHIFWIPVFPYGKEVSVFCEKCGLARHDLVFTESLFTNTAEVKSRFRHPWYTYGWSIIFLLLFLVPTIIRLSE